MDKTSGTPDPTSLWSAEQDDRPLASYQELVQNLANKYFWKYYERTHQIP